MSAKIPSALLEETIDEILRYSSEVKKRNFVESVEIQLGLKNFDHSKDKRIASFVRLPHRPKRQFTICILGDIKTCNEAKRLNLPCRSEAELKALKKDKKKVKALAAQFDAFICGQTLMRKLTRIMGPGLNRAGKYPTMLGSSEDMAAKVESVACTARIQMKSKKTYTLGFAVGNVAMTREMLAANIKMAINGIVDAVPGAWQQVRRFYIKSTMGPPHKIYGL